MNSVFAGLFHLSCIFSRMGTIMSNLGLLAGSSFMQIFISLQMWGEMPGGIVGRSPSSATFMPISMFERSAKGTSLVTSSQSNTAKLHMSEERRLISSGFFCRAEKRKDISESKFPV